MGVESELNHLSPTTRGDSKPRGTGTGRPFVKYRVISFLKLFFFCFFFFCFFWVFFFKISAFIFYFFNFFLNLFIYRCVGSSFLCEGLLQPRQAGATPHRGARTSHYRGLSCCGAQAPDAQAQ